MIPVLSSLPIRGVFVGPVQDPDTPLVDHALGGEALNVTDAGGFTREWTLEYVSGDFRLYREGVAPVVVHSAAGVTELSLSFNLTMRPHIAYSVGAQGYLLWYDSLSSANSVLSLGAVETPKVGLDETRDLFSDIADVVLAYVKDGDLCVRVQRERFQTEHLLEANIGGNILNIGPADNLRFQFEFRE